MLSTLLDWLKRVFNFSLFIYLQVAMFFSSRSSHYLNVTLSNLVKVHVLSGVYNELSYYRYSQK